MVEVFAMVDGSAFINQILAQFSRISSFLSSKEQGKYRQPPFHFEQPYRLVFHKYADPSYFSKSCFKIKNQRLLLILQLRLVSVSWSFFNFETH